MSLTNAKTVDLLFKCPAPVSTSIVHKDVNLGFKFRDFVCYDIAAGLILCRRAMSTLCIDERKSPSDVHTHADVLDDIMA